MSLNLVIYRTVPEVCRLWYESFELSNRSLNVPILYVKHEKIYIRISRFLSFVDHTTQSFENHTIRIQNLRKKKKPRNGRTRKLEKDTTQVK